jgi:Flp pilus assembly pilin Flp
MKWKYEGHWKCAISIKGCVDWFGADSESGVTAIEYGLLASLIALVIIVGVALLGTNFVVSSLISRARSLCHSKKSIIKVGDMPK